MLGWAIRIFRIGVDRRSPRLWWHRWCFGRYRQNPVLRFPRSVGLVLRGTGRPWTKCDLVRFASF